MAPGYQRTAGRPCSVCTHAQKGAIELAILKRESFRGISRRYGMHAESVARHVENHMHMALDNGGVGERQTQLAHLGYLQTQTLSLLEKATDQERLGTAMVIVKEARANLELQAKLTGLLDERPQINILVTPQWQRVEDALIAALLPFPDALEAARGALSSIES